MPERPAALLWVIFLAYFTFGMITNILGVVIPEVIKQYQLSLFAAGFLAFAFFLAYGLCSIPTGLLMDRFGARPLVLLGVFLMGLGCLVVSRAGDYLLIVGMIFAVGVGVTIIQTAGNPLIRHLDRLENYHRNLTLTIGFCGIGAFLGPFILAFIRGMGRSWQVLYLVFAAISLVLLLLLATSRFPARATVAGERIRLFCGVPCKVISISAASCSDVISFGRPERGRSSRIPTSPSARKRPRQSKTVGRLVAS